MWNENSETRRLATSETVDQEYNAELSNFYNSTRFLFLEFAIEMKLGGAYVYGIQ